MKLIWYGHACFKLESAEGSVVIDPYAPGYVPGLAMPSELTADTVVCSHDHADHNCDAAVTLTGNTPLFKLTRLSAYHDAVSGKKRGENQITIIDAEGQRIVHLGDLGHELTAQQLDALGAVDVLLIPVGGFYTVDAATAHRIAAAVNARITVPMHYKGVGFGFDELSDVEEFLRLADKVVRADSNVLSLPFYDTGVTLLLRCPTA